MVLDAVLEDSRIKVEFSGFAPSPPFVGRGLG